jgi:hypothetical protein
MIRTKIRVYKIHRRYVIFAPNPTILLARPWQIASVPEIPKLTCKAAYSYFSKGQAYRDLCWPTVTTGWTHVNRLIKSQFRIYSLWLSGYVAYKYTVRPLRKYYFFNLTDVILSAGSLNNPQINKNTLSVNGCTVLLLDVCRFFSFVILYTVGRTPWTGDQPVSRPLPTHRTTQT